ncbi:hypothetical protein MPAR168_00045 [Methylorubrum populi]|uniref:Adenosylcobinamide amidohydrolase n=1 Tax=Methylobacterium radiotolerans TaxID=31998 RepID=A0ABU7T4M2_9HYPH
MGYRRHGNAVSGTGTDCIVAAAPQTGEPALFAGLHTPVGEAVGAAVLAAISEGGASGARRGMQAALASPHDRCAAVGTCYTRDAFVWSGLATAVQSLRQLD